MPAEAVVVCRTGERVSDRLLVLGWHNVDGTWCFPSAPGAGRRGLERQLRFLARASTVVPLDQALDALVAGRPLPPRAVAITFDDGYADNVTLAVPLLERLRLPATFFLVPGLLSGEVRAWWEVLGWGFGGTSRTALAWEGARYAVETAGQRRSAYERVAEQLKRRNREQREAAVTELLDRLAPVGTPRGPELFLDWTGARELVRRGFAVGSHSTYHAILSKEDEPAQQADLRESRRRLEDELQAPTPLLAYPNGTMRDYDAATIAATAQAGHRYAVTTVDGWNHPSVPPFEIRRSVIYPERGLLDLALTARQLLRPTPR